MLSLLAACILLSTPPATPEVPAAEPHLYVNETSLGVVLGYNLNELSFVASHCEAINRYMDFQNRAQAAFFILNYLDYETD